MIRERERGLDASDSLLIYQRVVLVICDVAIDIHPSCSSGARDVNVKSLFSLERAPFTMRACARGKAQGGRSESVCTNTGGAGARRGEQSLCGEVLGCLSAVTGCAKPSWVCARVSSCRRAMN